MGQLSQKDLIWLEECNALIDDQQIEIEQTKMKCHIDMLTDILARVEDMKLYLSSIETGIRAKLSGKAEKPIEYKKLPSYVFKNGSPDDNKTEEEITAERQIEILRNGGKIHYDY